MKTRLILPVLTALLLGALTGCMKDRYEAQNPADGSYLTLTVSVPGASTPNTRSIGQVEENHIATLDVLAFKDDGAGGETFLYVGHGTDINNNNGAVNQKTFKVLLKQTAGTDEHKFVILANLRDEIDAVKSSFTSSMSKAQVLELVRFESGGKWNATSSASYTKLPMWGETASYAVTPTLTFPTIALVRSIARIDVGINVTGNINSPVANGLGNVFKISDINVYNTNKKGYAAPLDANMGTGGNAGKAILPTVAAAYAERNTAALAYPLSPAGYGLMQGIYISEVDNKTQTDPAKAPCLVIGGYYTKPGDALNTTVKTWYRVDFYERITAPQAQQKLDILRNHRYLVNITSIDGEGYPTEAEAFGSDPLNMDGGVLQWNEGDLGDITFDGQNYLAVRPSSELEYYMEAETQSITLKTDVAAGWKITKITEADGTTPATWFSTDKTPGTLYGAGEATVPVGITVTDNATGSPRTGYIWIKAGRLEARITVLQHEYGKGNLSITDDSFNTIANLVWFTEADEIPAVKKYQVNWAPETNTLKSVKKQVQIIDASYYPYVEWQSWRMISGLDDNTGSDIYLTDITNGSGKVEHTALPTTYTTAYLETDPFPIRRTQIDYTVGTGSAAMTQKVILQHSAKNMTIETDADLWRLDASTHTVTVKSSVPWVLKAKSNAGLNGAALVTGNGITAGSSIDVVVASGNPNLPSGTVVTFATVDDMTNKVLLYGELNFELSSQEMTTTKTLSIPCGSPEPESNCYIVTPGGKPAVIPVSRANNSTILTAMGLGTTKQIADGVTCGSELVWTDNANGIAANSNIAQLQYVGKGGLGFLIVTPGSGEGNAVVAVTVGSGTDRIKWSWHIWVTNSKATIESSNLGTNLNGAGITYWMDRNLGAMRAGNDGWISPRTSGDPVMGLYYQWGRKDPFPNTNDKIYSGAGSITWGSKGAASNTLISSVQNPFGWAAAWSGSSGATSWVNGGKTVFDPCPAGWKVPPMGITGSAPQWGVWGPLASITIVSNSGVRINNSVFFPGAGYRNGSSFGQLTLNNGVQIHSANQYDASNNYKLGLWTDGTANTAQNYSSKVMGQSIRCVRE